MQDKSAKKFFKHNINCSYLVNLAILTISSHFLILNGQYDILKTSIFYIF